MSSSPPRERYRAQVRAEVKEHAWAQIAEAGASALSLNAIAKKMGMSGPALYRYFANRDELITDLVTDAYRQLVDAFRAAVEAKGSEPVVIAHAMRDWALAHPQRYFLIYGTPIPGYHAPPQTRDIAAELMNMLLAALRNHRPGEKTPFDEHLDTHRDWAGTDDPPETLRTALRLWARMHGVISLEIAGHFDTMGFDTTLFFESEVDAMLER
ncbi:TetR/AcrR family transcriptional regulator [Actinophytocola glycyrrhizae]|uniref:TetR/AcrR family transcriptional regulator n=1 Tax=Actinophytocola glycyrrhizae TaxID=2044873 RepID=A0ABV9RXP3_9PSEU